MPVFETVSVWLPLSPGSMLVTLNDVAGVTLRMIVPDVQLPFEASLSVKSASDIAPAPSVANDAPSRMANRARRRFVRRLADVSVTVWSMCTGTPYVSVRARRSANPRWRWGPRMGSGPGTRRAARV